MVENTRDPIGYYIYYSDSGSGYVQKMTSSVAAAGGFVKATAQDLISLVPVHNFFLHKQLRHVSIKTPDNLKHDRIPFAQRTNTVYLQGGPLGLNIAGRTDWICTGRKGESQTFE